MVLAQAEGNDEEENRIAAELLDKPKNFNPYDPENIIKVAEESFEDICTVMEENGVAEPKALTEFEFYSKLRFYNKKYQKDGGSKQV